MQIQLLSDLHFEFHRDHGRAFVAELDPRGVDVLVLAGDICPGWGIEDSLPLFCAKFPAVLYLPGNHEYYRCSKQMVESAIRAVARKCKNLHWLDASAVQIGSQRFVGATLWFPPPTGDAVLAKGLINDFSLIPDLESWAYAEHRRAVTFLEQNALPDTVVCTHHLPVPESIAPQFRDSELNPFFCTDLTALVGRAQPRAWLHGHTHVSLDYRLGCGTRVVCNPFGYLRVDQNLSFDYRKLIEP